MEKSWCFSDMAMGQSQESSIENIIYVKPDCFDPAKTREIAKDIETLNGRLKALEKKYFLIGVHFRDLENTAKEKLVNLWKKYYPE